MNLYSYDYYDPGWHKYEPKAEDILTEARLEKRWARSAKGWPRLLSRLPWPIRVIPPFVITVSLPIFSLAMMFGASVGHVPSSESVLPPLNLTLAVVAADSELATSNFLQTSSSLIGWDMTVTVMVTNPSPERDAWVTVAVPHPSRAGVIAAYPLAPQLIRAGSTGTIVLQLRKLPYFHGEKRLEVFLEPVRPLN